jgi:hypothetical protein
MLKEQQLGGGKPEPVVLEDQEDPPLPAENGERGLSQCQENQSVGYGDG